MQATPSVPNRVPRTSRRTRWVAGIIVAAIVVIVFTGHDVASFYTGYLWFGEVKLTSVWTKTLEIQVVLSAVFILGLFGLVWGNLLLADRLAPFALLTPPDDELVGRWKSVATGRLRWIRLVVAAVFALVGGFGAHTQWNNWILFSNRVSFHQVDPLNHLDDSFYVFQLPFINWLLNWLFVAVIVTFLLVLVAHYLNGGIHPQAAGQRVTAPVKVHLSVLLAVLSLIKGVGYYFERLSLVLSTKHIVDGATYTDVHANRPAIVLLMAISVIAAGLFLYNIRQRGWLLPGIAVALWVLVWVLIGNVYPAVVQALSVNPSENVKEQPYIKENIQATLFAYGLGNVNTKPYDGTSLVNSSQVTGDSPEAQANERSIANVRLLDPDYLGSTFAKFQELKGYYSLSNPESDRYRLANGQETPALVSVRELNEAPGTQATSNWVNQHLQYTHGYGAVVAAASQAGVDISSGYPRYSLGGIPATGTPSLAKQPRVYYGIGSQTTGYVIADSAQQELDYENAAGSQVPYSYAGSGGVPIGGFVRRLAFTASFGDLNILISGQVKSSSRIMYNRNVVQRVQKAAPFLSYDSDPYPVVVDGGLYWVVDGYTTTANFPYSQVADTSRLPSGAQLADAPFNYVRNSVKAVVNAYTGKITLFVQDPQDPIIQAYEKAFPALFTPVDRADSLIPGITSHWRYPEDIFTVQTNMYSTYHQTNPNVFFQKAQAWGVAQGAQAGTVGATTSTTVTPAANQLANPQPAQTTPMPPTYELMHLPGQTQQNFVLVEAYVNQAQQDKQQNLAAFMTASSDPSNYGQLTVYATPAGTVLPGPYLVSGIISSNQSISDEITLLNQENSQVVLGTAVLLPVDQSLLYVQPLYVQSNTNKVPRLDDVIVVYNNQAYHSGNASLDGALCAVTNPDGSRPFQSYCATTAAQTKTSTPTGTTTNPTATKTTSSSSSSTTVAPTTVPNPPSGATVQSLLQQAQRDFAAAQAALTQGNLGVYQQQTAAGETAVNQAAILAGITPTATTTTAPSAHKTTTTTAKSSG